MLHENLIVKRIREIQSSLGEGDQVVIWKDEYQISEDGNVPTNYDNMTDAEIIKVRDEEMGSLNPKPIRLQDLEDRIVSLEDKLSSYMEKTPHDHHHEDEGMSRYAR